MAKVTSGSFNTNAYTTEGKTRYLTLSWERTSFSVADNTSTISYTLKGNGTYSGYIMTRNISLVINGTKVYTASGPIKVYKGTVLKTGTITITHNSDGTKEFSASAECGIYYSAINSTGSGSWEMVDIPRASSIKATDADIGSKTTITITRASTSFTNTLTWSCLGLSGTIATKTTSASAEFTIPTSLYEKIPNDPSAKVTITCETFNGSTSLGTSTCEFTATANKNTCKPTLSYGSILDINTVTKALTGDNKKFIKGYSNAQISGVSATGKNSAYIKSIEFKCDTKTATVSNGTATISSVTKGEFTVTATDSRGYTTTLTHNATLYDYFKPTITSEIERVVKSGNIVKAEYSGTVCNNEISKGFTIDFRYLKTDGKYSDWLSISKVNADGTKTGEITTTGNNYKGSVTFDIEFDYRREHKIEIRITDCLDSASVTRTLIRSFPAFDWGESGFNFNIPLFYDGKPMDFVVEQGTSGVWTYRKWYSGFAECHGYHEISGVDVTTAWGTWFYSSEITLPTYPFTFKDIPCVNVSLQSDHSVVLDGIRGGSATTVGKTFMYRPFEETGVKGRFTIYAYGRWK